MKKQVKDIYPGYKVKTFTVISKTDKPCYWLLKCECGKEGERSTNNIKIESVCCECQKSHTVKYSLSKVCKGCKKTYLNTKGLSKSKFYKGVFCTEECRIKHTDFRRNFKDLKGFEINGLRILGEKGISCSNILWEVQCYCGNIFSTRASRLKSGATSSCGCYQKKMASQRAKKRVGPKNSRWDNTKTIEDRLSVRDSTEYRKWRKGVYKRDKGRCKICQKNNNLHAHHLDGWISCKERRVELQNGVLLCKDCHKNFHKIYGVGDNTAEEFIEYYLLKCVKLKICV